MSADRCCSSYVPACTPVHRSPFTSKLSFIQSPPTHVDACWSLRGQPSCGSDHCHVTAGSLDKKPRVIFDPIRINYAIRQPAGLYIYHGAAPSVEPSIYIWFAAVALLQNATGNKAM